VGRRDEGACAGSRLDIDDRVDQLLLDLLLDRHAHRADERDDGVVAELDVGAAVEPGGFGEHASIEPALERFDRPDLAGAYQHAGEWLDVPVAQHQGVTVVTADREPVTRSRDRELAQMFASEAHPKSEHAHDRCSRSSDLQRRSSACRLVATLILPGAAADSGR